jgi:hypothetical protein
MVEVKECGQREVAEFVSVTADLSRLVSDHVHWRPRSCQSNVCPFIHVLFSFSPMLGPEHLSANNLWKHCDSSDTKRSRFPSIE